MSTLLSACAPPLMMFIIGTRHRVAVAARAEQLVQRDAALRRVRLRVRERHGQDRVRAEPGLVRRAVELDEPAVELALPRGVEADDGLADLAVDVRDGLR